jgi:hypothetical protein
MSADMLPAVLHVLQQKDAVSVARTLVSEYETSTVQEETLALDGTPTRSELRGSPRVTSVRWSEAGDGLRIESTVTWQRGDRSAELVSTEDWQLREDGRQLAVRLSSGTPWGQRQATLLYERQ